MRDIWEGLKLVWKAIKALFYTIILYVISTTIGCGSPTYIPVVTPVIVFGSWVVLFFFIYGAFLGDGSEEEEKKPTEDGS